MTGGEMRCAQVFFLLTLLSLLTGCFPVIYSEQPLGQQAVLDPKVWNGQWLANDGSWSTMSVVDSNTLVLGKRGVCNPSPMERREETKLRQTEGLYILQQKITEAADPRKVGLYRTDALLWLRGQTLYGFWPNEERVKALIEQGEIPGRIEGSHPILGALTPEHYNLIFALRRDSVEYPLAAKNDSPMLPLVASSFIKLPDELNPCKKGESGK
jgi:hypothetical protein